MTYHKANHKRHFGRSLSVGAALLAAVCLAGTLPAQAQTVEFKERKGGLYKDIFNENFYHEFTSYLHLERFYRKITGTRSRAANVNLFDEVPDSAFFVNRHAKSGLSTSELSKGFQENSGPDLSGPLKVVKGKFEGVHPGFFVEDARGDRYLLKFDRVDGFERETSAEVITSRFYHAIGYHVPQYTVLSFPMEKLTVAPGAKVYDESGFKKDLTQHKLEDYMLFLPQDRRGHYRASASKILKGEPKGPFSFQTRRREDPEDTVDHKDRREIRALRVFASWLNHYDLRESNTLDMLVSEDGRQSLKHYLIDFNSSLGAGHTFPMFTHEYMADYGEAAKAYFAFGLWEKPWQARWREAGNQVNASPAVGDFDNRRFDPGAFKTQLPYYAFKDMTFADAFWAAKIIMSFSDEDIRAMVRAGEFSSKQDEEYVARTLAERRDLIGKYWFDRANPLDSFDVKGSALTFADLGLKHGFYPAQGTVYQIDPWVKNGKSKKRMESVQVRETSVDLGTLLSQNETVILRIRTQRPGTGGWSPDVLVKIKDGKIHKILHQD